MSTSPPGIRTMTGQRSAWHTSRTEGTRSAGFSDAAASAAGVAAADASEPPSGISVRTATTSTASTSTTAAPMVSGLAAPARSDLWRPTLGEISGGVKFSLRFCPVFLLNALPGVPAPRRGHPGGPALLEHLAHDRQHRENDDHNGAGEDEPIDVLHLGAEEVSEQHHRFDPQNAAGH